VENRFNPTISELEAGTVTRTYYDHMPARDILGVELYPVDLDTAEAFKYNRGRVVATISDVYIPKSPDGTPLQTTDGVDSVTRASTANVYDKRGRVIESYIYNGSVTADSLKMVATATEYDLAGKILQVTKYPYGLSDGGKSRKVVERYSYDRLGRVDTLYVTNGSSSETVLAAYEYYPTGSVKSIKMGNTITLDYEYHISGAVKSAVAYVLDNATSGSNGGSSGGVLNESTTAASSVPKVLYSETLYYEDCDSEGCTPQYNGNISRMVHRLAHINQFFSTERDVAYYYDELNRLTKVDDKNERDFYDEAFTYDPQGRITSQRRDGYINNATGGEYSYYAQSNRLEKVSAGMSSDVDFNRNMTSNENFVYDHDGNMIEDKSKQMTVRYNHRGLPVEFKRESSSSENGADSVRLILNYDGAGSRISKIRERKSASETEWTTELATHYTGIGSEIREDAINNATKVVVNLPQSLGRYDIEDASNQYAGIDPEQLAGYIPPAKFEWYLKNHLGSTMLVYGTQSYGDLMKPNFVGLKSAYDYRAFGEQVDLTMPTDKVTETFTGKEKDDETELSYFGARYLDQMLGMWVSVDAKRQFNSPYLYAGNGTNPVRFFDPNGKEITFASDLEKQMYIELRSSLTPMAQERIQVLEKSKNIYKLNYRPAETRNQEMVFDENGSVLSQDKGGTKNGGFVPKANGGDIFFDGTKESLGHELGGHGFQMEYLLGNALQQGLSGDDAVFHFNSKYTNEENFRIGVEKDAANAGGHDFDEEYYKN
jgi:RHS repeat-associated protein